MPVPRIDDRAYVDAEYADEGRLGARAGLWTACPGPQPQDVARERIVRLAPASVLEVGCGQGVLASRLVDAGLDVTAVDRSQRMVEITASRGVRASRADVQDLPFADATFDLVLAAYMLYHVPDLPRALAQIARVLRPEGTFVAVTNSVTKLRELWDLVGRDDGDETFSRENGAEVLRPFFGRIERVDVDRRFRVSETAARDYVRATRFAALADRVPALPDGLEVTAAGSVFIARR